MKSNKAHRRILNGIIGADLPVVEGKRIIHIQVSPSDVKNAVPGDGDKCALALACKRIYGSRVAYFFRTVAYLELLDGKGKRQLQRFNISENGREFVKKIDAEKKVNPAGFDLLPPSDSTTLDALIERNENTVRSKHKYLAKGKAILVGKTDDEGNRSISTGQFVKGNTPVNAFSKRKQPKISFNYSRLKNASGTGKVHFSKKG